MIRRAPKPGGEFLLVRNSVVRDSRLSYRARGLLVMMLSYADNWTFSRDWLAGQSSGEGERAVRTALQELERCGYLHRTRVKLRNGRFGWEHTLYDTPHNDDVSAGRTTGQKPPDGFPPGGNPPSLENHQENHQEDVLDRVPAPSSPGSDSFVVGTGNLVLAPNPSTDDQKPATDEPPDDWRAEDRENFCRILGPQLISDGSRWRKGEFNTIHFYDAFRTHKTNGKKPIDWPGKFLEYLEGDYGSGVENWLIAQGLEQVE